MTSISATIAEDLNFLDKFNLIDFLQVRGDYSYNLDFKHQSYVMYEIIIGMSIVVLRSNNFDIKLGLVFLK